MLTCSARDLGVRQGWCGGCWAHTPLRSGSMEFGAFELLIIVLRVGGFHEFGVVRNVVEIASYWVVDWGADFCIRDRL